MKPLILIVLAIALGAACGGGNGDNETQASPTTTTPDDPLTAQLRRAVSDATIDLDAHLRGIASVVRRTEKGNTVATRPPEKGRDRRSPPTP